ncbi:hypothetical protein B0H66DRAFT_514015 [Apodospora peruviana]|uniref:Rhodopsin domain-containing protein n=1 Tax=Apodospora peruviana TaxID=516989 RepID=A0AAE0M7V9_9PEZI|nr:hypothetical protein B0H66DRAFT_514015 [Apodospora peruviana]
MSPDGAKLDPRVDYGPQVNLVVWVIVSISALFLFTRLYLKNCQNRGLWWDDYALLTSWALLTAQAALVSYVIGLGYGRQVIPTQNIPKFPLPINLLSTLLITANLLGKISFAMTLLRIPAVWMRTALVCIVISMVGTLGASAGFVWVECVAWSPSKNCVSLDIAIKYNVFSCAYSAAMDVTLAFLPWKYIWTLQMSKKEKCGVVVAMSMGVFAGIAAAIKTTTIPLVHHTIDPTSSIPLVAWGNAEAGICIMAASIPILRALFKGNISPGAPLGYETGETSVMTESGIRELGSTSVEDRARIFSRQAIPPPLPMSHRQNTDTNSSSQRVEVWKLTEKERYRYECQCRPPFMVIGNKSKKCDDGKTCLCGKSPKAHPNNWWIVTHSGRRKFFAQHDHIQLRRPDSFALFSFMSPDHERLGVLEVIESWTLSEATDSCHLARLIGRTFVSMLARLEREGLLVENSEVENLSQIVTLFLVMAEDMRLMNMLDDDDSAGDITKLRGSGGIKRTFYFDMNDFDGIVLAYTKKYGISLNISDGITEIPDDCSCRVANIELPALPIMRCNRNPFNLAPAFARYEKACGWGNDNPDKKPKIGGDHLDITTMSSLGRVMQSLTGKDPLSSQEQEWSQKRGGGGGG